MTKTGSSRFMSMFLSVCMVFMCMVGMSVTASAEELSESFATNQRRQVYTGDHFTFSVGEPGDNDGFKLNQAIYKNANATITALNGETITKVELIKGFYDITRVRAAKGTVTYAGNVAKVSEVNDTSLTLYGAAVVQIKQVIVYYAPPSTVAVTGVTLDKTTASLTVGDDAVKLTATVTPDNATNKKVKWSITGSAVTLYSDANCTAGNEIGTDATETLTVYAKGISAGSATVTATSNADSNKTASCAITVNAAHTHDFTYNASGATITAACTTGCDITEGLTMTISAPTSLTYDGTAKTAALSTGYNTTAFPDTYTIEYYKGTAKLDSAPADAGTYTAKVTAGTATASVDFTITPKTVSSPEITLSPESCIYDGTAKEPAVTVKDGTTTIPESEYDVSYSDNTNAGTATVTVSVKEGGNYVVSGEKTFNIAKAEPAFMEPEAKTDLIYTGEEQELVTPGTTEDGTMEYSLDGNSYSEDTPTAVNVGSYTVYWRITGDNNHSDKTPSTLAVSIAKADSDALSPMPVQGLVYTGEEQALLTVPTGNATIYYYKLTDDEDNDITDYSTEIPTGTDAGMYNVTWYAEGDDNHNDSVPQTITVSIAKADPVVTAPHAADDLVEYGHPHALVEGGTTSGGAIWYSLDGGDFSTDIPIATDAGTYTVTWMVMGDDNYNGTVDETIYVVIAAKEDGTFPVPSEDGSAPVYYTAVKEPSGAAPSLVAGVSEEEEMLTWNAQLSGTTLTWDAKDGADGYVISIRGKGDKAFRRLDRVTDKSAVLSDLKPGTYTVYIRYEKDGKLAKCRQSARTTITIG